MVSEFYFAIEDNGSTYFRKLKIKHSQSAKLDGIERLIDWNNQFNIKQISKGEFENKKVNLFSEEEQKEENGWKYKQIKISI